MSRFSRSATPTNLSGGYNAGLDCVRELVSYDLSQWFTLSSDKVDVVTALAQDAQGRAEAIASATGVSIGPLQSADSGGGAR